MKVVLDTNVVISGIFFPGPPSLILEAWRQGRFQLVISREIFEEYARTASFLAEKYPPIDIEGILTIIKKDGEFYNAPALAKQVCVDPADDKFLACALKAGAAIIISGDKHLLDVSEFHGIKILRPREFIERFLTGET